MLETPVWLTSTMQLGRVYDAACELELDRHPEVADDVCIPVVAECDDSFLNDCRPMWVTADDVRAAHAAALASRGSSTPPDEGSVGVGHRDVLPGLQGRHRHVVAGDARRPHGRGAADDQLRRAGAADRRRRPRRPAARRLARAREAGRVRASASSSPTRRSTRPGASGWPGGSGSVWRAPGPWPTTAAARSSWPRARPRAPTATARQLDTGPRLGGRQLDDLFAAVVDAAEESVLNSLLMSPTTVGRDGNTSEGLDPEVVRRLVEEHRAGH